MNNQKQIDKALGKLQSGLAATVYTQQPGIDEINIDTKRGSKRKGDFKKVTFNLDVDLNRKLDAYINMLRGKAIEDGTDPPNKSEWVRDIIEEKLRELRAL